ncbi:MAG: glucans biosynthesis glucosyltransferase MdoH [Hyphomicrobiaceae bacterium]
MSADGGADLLDVGPRWLPPAQPINVPVQGFAVPPPVRARFDEPALWVPRAAILFGGVLLTVAFAAELYAVLSFVRMTPMQFLFLVFSTVAFSWIAFGTLSAAIGFLPLFARDHDLSIELPPAATAKAGRTALLFPVYHEAPARIAACIEAITEDLSRLNAASGFDVFILSDTRGHDDGNLEASAYALLRDQVASSTAIYYRRRAINTAKKAGNIKDWLERFGGGYSTFVILDADSVMSGETLVRLAGAMAEHPNAGLIQTVPKLAGGRTTFQKLQQFAAGVYGPSVSMGLAVWHRHQGNYWGHNAIIRTQAFAYAAGLPELPGRPPFGGNILSHDFVEAVLLQRAGWAVHMAPTIEGSYEGAPPGLIELAVRDRRWAQGNLQHLAIVTKPGLTPMGRIHLGMGICAYLVSAVWAMSLIIGVVLALQGQQLVPSYFQDSKTLTPIWPVIDPGAAFRLFIATMSVVLLPKALGLMLEIERSRLAAQPVGVIRAIAGVGAETILSMLFAPILMVTQTSAVTQILLGRDAGWKSQRRDDGGIAFMEAVRFHRWHLLLGLAATAICYIVSYALMAWTAPILLGLLLSVLLSWATARPAGPILSWLLSTVEDRNPPAILRRVDALSLEWERRLSGVVPAERPN